MAQIERIDRLVDSILASVRIGARRPGRRRADRVEAAIREVVELGRAARSASTTLDIQPGVAPHALADEPRLRQIIEHLVENAVKYAPPETAITIETLLEGVVRIGVNDDGPGVPEEWRERIFEPYARRETHTARGSGIGLYAARRLGQSMGARLWCEPVDPTGARFVVALPGRGSGLSRIDDRPHAAPLRILVVDDDPAMVGAITALVGIEGHQVITAYDGLTAIKRFDEERPDIVLLDLAMPGPDGFTVAGRIRAAGPTPILVVSGESGEAAKVRALGIGADDYLAKPFGAASCWPGSQRSCAASTGRAGATTSGPLTAGALVLEPARHEAHVGDEPLVLTPTEYRLLEALARAAGDIVPHHLLARAGWPAESDPDLLWLKPHLARLRAKVEAAGGPAIVAIRGVGYRIDVEGARTN